MSITRHTIKRLETEMEKIKPDKTRLFTCMERDGIFYYNDKPYKTIKELEVGEGIKDYQTLIICKDYVRKEKTKQ